YNAISTARAINIVDVAAGNVFGTEINSGASTTFATIDFANKINVTVKAVDGPDTITLNNPHPDTLNPSPLTTLELDLAKTPTANFLGAPIDTKDPNTVDLQDLPPGVAKITVQGTDPTPRTTLEATTSIANTWNVTGTGVMSMDGVVSATGITNALGTGTDEFDFEPGGSIPGFVDAGPGMGVASLNYSAL